MNGTGAGRARGRATDLGAGLAVLMLAAVGATAAVAQEAPRGAYGFAAPPSVQANRVYSVNRQTGEMSACQFERADAAQVGSTRCFSKGEGAGAQKPGLYDLVVTHFTGETGVFRVNAASGEMSVCYVRDMPKAGGGNEPVILCTPAAR